MSTKWDGRSRPSTELYKKNYNDIFKKKKKPKKNKPLNQKEENHGTSR